MNLFNWFKSTSNFLDTDLHSHLIPDIDDGVGSWDESIQIIQILHKLGYKKLITTPHVIENYYPNKPEVIRDGVSELNQRLSEQNIDLVVEAGAEYLVDEHFVEQVRSKQSLMSFGDGYVLIETPFMNKPLFLEETIFNLQANGYKPILAHPERYSYLQSNLELLESLISMGLFMQVNISSLTGYYSKSAKKLARFLIDRGQVHFLASDIHNLKHLEEVKKAFKSKLFQRCRQLPLLNSSL